MQYHWSAAARLLDRGVPEGYLEERTKVVSGQKRVVEPGTKSAVIFRLGREWLGLPTGIFQEVAERSEIHKLPHHTGGILRGLVNVRGDLLMCIALDVLLGLEKSPEATAAKDPAKEQLLVCDREGNRLAFYVSEVHGVHRFHPRDLKEVPSTVAKSGATYAIGLLQWGDKTVGCLDDGLLFYAFNKGLA